MDNNVILFPAIAMFTLTMGVTLSLGRARLKAIRSRKVSIKYFRTYNEGSQPERLHLLARHLQNHFEVPPLFYVAILLCYVTGAVSWWSVALCWLFFLARCVHTYIHLGSNNVSARFFTFGTGLIFLTGIWISLLIHLLLHR